MFNVAHRSPEQLPQSAKADDVSDKNKFCNLYLHSESSTVPPRATNYDAYTFGEEARLTGIALISMLQACAFGRRGKMRAKVNKLLHLYKSSKSPAKRAHHYPNDCF